VQARKLAHSAAPPLQIETVALGFDLGSGCAAVGDLVCYASRMLETSGGRRLPAAGRDSQNQHFSGAG